MLTKNKSHFLAECVATVINSQPEISAQSAIGLE